jgi:hypothetical protein
MLKLTSASKKVLVAKTLSLSDRITKSWGLSRSVIHSSTVLENDPIPPYDDPLY